MKKVNFGLIFQIIQILAIGFVVFMVLRPASANKQLDAIEANQVKLKKIVDEVMTTNRQILLKHDSTDSIKMIRIEKLNSNILSGISQMKATNRKIDGWKSIFDQNKVVLPDPDKN